jgi:hypothetical protein
MSMYGWQQQDSGLAVREDEYSWQGSSRDDPLFFIRMSKSDPSMFTDFLFGNLPDDQIVRLLSDFVSLHSGFTKDRIVFTAISSLSDSPVHTSSVFDRIVRIGKEAALSLGRVSKDSFLEQYGTKWNAVILLEPRSSGNFGVVTNLVR